MRPWVLKLIVYGTTFMILLVVFYFYERGKAGPVKPRAVLIMAELAMLFALFPATAYLLLAGLLKSTRDLGKFRRIFRVRLNAPPR